MDQWAPEDVEAHIAFMKHVSELLEENGEYVDAQALTRARTWVGYAGPDVAPVTTDWPAARDQRPGRGLVHDRRRVPRARGRTRVLRFLRARPRRRGPNRVQIALPVHDAMEQTRVAARRKCTWKSATRPLPDLPQRRTLVMTT